MKIAFYNYLTLYRYFSHEILSVPHNVKCNFMCLSSLVFIYENLSLSTLVNTDCEFRLIVEHAQFNRKNEFKNARPLDK